MSNIKKQAIFQKSTISIVIISAVTAGLIALEQSVNKNDLFSTQQNSTYQDSQHKKTELKTMTNTEFSEISLVEDIAPVTESLDLAQRLDLAELDVQAVQVEPQVELVNNSIIEKAMIEKNIIDTAIKGNVLFDFSSSEIGPEYYQLLLETAQLITSSDTDTQTLWQVVGYADLTGNHQFNIDLAKRRAQTVATFLVDNGVDEAQLSIVSLGDTNPIEADQKRGANQLDRRVEIHSYQAEITALAEQLNRKNKPTAKILAISEEQVLAITEQQIIPTEKKSAAKSFTPEKSAPTELTKQLPATSNLIIQPAKSNLFTSSTKIDF